MSFAAVPLFAMLDSAWIDRLTAVSTARAVAPDTVVAVRGTPADRLVVVESGVLTAVHDTAAGQRRRLGEFAGPCAVDKAAVLDSRGHTATWIAATRCQLGFVPAAEFRTLLDEVPEARRHVFAVLAKSLRDQQEDLVYTSFADATTRTAAWLVRQGGSRVPLPGAQQGLAEAIGMTRVSVNRALRALADDGIVAVEPGAVRILAPDRLRLRLDR